jgi:signal transduction histidine kinase
VSLNRSALSLAIKAGDNYYTSACSLTDVILRLHQGAELTELVSLIRAGLERPRTTRHRQGVEEHLVFLQAIRTLQGLTMQPEVGAAVGVALDASGLPVGITAASGKLFEYQIVLLGVAYLMRDFNRAFELATAVSGKLTQVPRFVQHVEHNFYSSLTLAARWEHVPAGARSELLAAIVSNQAQLGLWAKNNPENYQHKHLLVAAELARLEGRGDQAGELYDQAIAAAGRERFLQDEALGNELCGRFYLDKGRKRVAALYLRAAIDGYARWGAHAKAEALEAELVESITTAERLRPSVERRPAPDKTGDAALDLLALFRAAEAMSREVKLPRLLDRLMEVCLATAGAERGAFVIEEEGQLFVRCVAAIGQPTVFQRTPVDSSPHLAAQVVHHVRDTAEALVVADACTHQDLAADPYIRGQRVRSLLALPILRQTELMGVLYLENNLAMRVFTSERVRLLMTLSSQIATSLQNSLLFEQLSQEVEERKRAEATIRFLADAGATLAESLEYQATLKRLAHLAVPVLCDWCVVHVVANGAVQWMASAHVDPRQEGPLQARNQREVGQPPPDPVLAVARSGTALVTDNSMVLPLQAQGRFLGAMTLASNQPDRRFGAPELAVAEELARRAALAIDNARLYREATEAVRLRDEFLSIASHELNTPIASLKLVSQSLEAPTLMASPASLTKVMNIVARQSQRLATLVSDLLDVAQIPTGNFKLRPEAVELGGLVRDALDLMRGDAERAKCRLLFTAEAGLVGQWDRVRLHQVVANLLSNAIKFAAGKDIEVTVARAASGKAQLVVTDQGIGVPPDRLPYIFGRFERAVSAQHYGGLGLGLYIVHAIVQAHGGAVTAASVLGQGAKFTVELPLATGAG